jgi:hypothetical protein
MFQSTIASLKSRVSALRSSKKQRRKSTAPAQSASETAAEKTPAVAPTPEVSLPPPSNDRPDVRYERKMGDSELSYYLPSRANGVNDMCAFPLAHSVAPSSLSVQVPPPRFQSTDPRHGTREGSRGMGHPPPEAPAARGDGADARLR